MALYETVLIARQDVSAAQVDAIAESLTSIVKENGGTVQKTENWGLRSLAYRIQKNRKGHYVLLGIDGPAQAIAEMERSLRFNEDVLRYMTVRVDEIDEEPSAILQQKDRGERPGGRGERGDRGPRGDRGGDRGYRPRRDDAEQSAKESEGEEA
ncbi:MAG: 30S ribosomal protein S6 [Alphaproteobacteria bacterium]|nr:30S ribosomal protein S6 [Alphaproteobacteria bacterium SS10]